MEIEYTNLKITKLPKSEIEIEGEIKEEAFEAYFERAVKHLGEHTKIDGFREGKVPTDILLKSIPEIKILEEMAEMALAEHYPRIVENEKLDVISRPMIAVTKLARKSPLGFKIRTATLPEVTLADYKKIAKKILSEITESEKSTDVTEEEVEKTLLDIRKTRAPKKHITDTPHPNPLLNEEREDSFSPQEKAGDEVLPELNDEFVQALGPFENVADFTDKLKQNLKLEKENQNKEKTRLKIIEAIIALSTTDVPDILVDSEVNKIIYRMESDITTMGLKFEDYLKHLNKTIEDLRKEFRGDGEKKAKLSLVLHEIGKVEGLKADEKDIETEVAMILEHYKDADPERARAHVENVLVNEKIFKFLESES